MKKVYDLAVIGGGIAGLSASIYAASEGLSTVICDGASRFGGQAGTATLIENLIGFPEGISGKDLTTRAIEQADKFDVEFKSPFNAVGIEKEGFLWKILSDDDEIVNAKAVLLAMGVDYRRLDAKNISRFLGSGVSYGSPSLSENFSDRTVSIIGGANSAGQAAVYLATCKNCNVHLIIRAEKIEDKMSDYLCKKIHSLPNIKIHVNSEVTECAGRDKLENITLKTSNGTAEITTQKLFILIGAKPKTAWLRGTVPMDDKGFIVTDRDLMAIPGIYSAGDARSESVKRVASALGEGSRTVNGIHAYVSELNSQMSE